MSDTGTGPSGPPPPAPRRGHRSGRPPSSPPPPPGGPPPPPGRPRKLAFLRERGGWLMLAGGLLIAGGLGLALAVLAILVIIQLCVNMFALPFTQELRWYGPGPLDLDAGLRNGILASTTVGSVLLVLGAVRRYLFESKPPASGP